MVYGLKPGMTIGTLRRYIRGRVRREKTMKIDDDDRPKKKIAHEIGADLSLVSVEELRERVVLLKEEIARLEADMARKQASKSAADTFFKR
jgi:uncharacterized small protein (DUF1192 family)